MSARYLIRMDDACHTMDRRKWQLVEDILDEHEIKPIVAVVPSNKDPFLMVDDYDTNFWNKVRRWQAKGWSIAMHGYTHEMHFTDSPLLLPYYKRSEFAGLGYEEQAAKIRASWRIFREQNVKVNAWIAPAHCFDEITLRAIRNETDIRIVSDGIALNVYYDNDFYWIPQQIWKLENRVAGLWSVCLHPNMMNEDAIESFGLAIRRRFKERIISLVDVELKQQPKSLAGALYHRYFWLRRKQFRFAFR